MDTILLTVTALSLAMAASMTLIVVKLLRQERARSEARVAALGALASDAAIDPAIRPATPVPRRLDVEPVVSGQPRARRSVPLDDLEIRPSGSAIAGVSHLFEQANEPSPWGRRLAVIGSLGAVVFAIGFAAVSGRLHPGVSTATASASPGQAAALDTVPLELLSLRHVQEAQRLVISGVVQNPRGGAPLSRVVATAYLFGPDGTFLTSSRAPLDFTTIAPGVECPFVVSVPVAGAVARYRIGFRTDDGRVISHVDRRGAESLAQK
jgi:hypothetical protein